jgi:arylsulfatase A-like enzyme
LDGGLPFLSPTYYAALYNSPFGNELLLDLAREAIAAEALGTRDVPDLLCLSFSCNDPVGHCWGPDSQEVLDCTLRADHVVRQLLEALDRQVGRGRYALVLTADHGACPLPEVSRANGLEAARVPATLLSKGAEAYLTGRYGAGEGKFRYLEATQGPWAYLNRRGIAQRGLDPEAVEADLAEWLRGQPGIAAVYTRAQLLAGVDAEDPIGRAVRKSFHPDRSGDLMVVVKPHHLFLTALTGTTHGTPHPYDTHVPLLVYAPGVAGGPRTEPVTPLAVPAILGRTLGITPPASAAYPVPGTLFASPK